MRSRSRSNSREDNVSCNIHSMYTDKNTSNENNFDVISNSNLEPKDDVDAEYEAVVMAKGPNIESTQRVLIDTGCTSGNFIKRSLLNYHMHRIFKNKEIFVKSPISKESLKVKQFVSIPLINLRSKFRESAMNRMAEDLKKGDVRTDIEHVEFAAVEDLGSYDMILGIHTVRKYDLTLVFRNHFVANFGMADVPVVLRTKEDDPATDLQAGGRETLQREGSIAKVNLRKYLNEGRHSSNPRTPWTRRKSREQLLDIEIDVDRTKNLPGTPWDEPGDEKPVKEGADGIKIDENPSAKNCRNSFGSIMRSLELGWAASRHELLHLSSRLTIKMEVAR